MPLRVKVFTHLSAKHKPYAGLDVWQGTVLLLAAVFANMIQEHLEGDPEPLRFGLAAIPMLIAAFLAWEKKGRYLPIWAWRLFLHHFSPKEYAHSGDTQVRIRKRLRS